MPKKGDRRAPSWGTLSQPKTAPRNRPNRHLGRCVGHLITFHAAQEVHSAAPLTPRPRLARSKRTSRTAALFGSRPRSFVRTTGGIGGAFSFGGRKYLFWGPSPDAPLGLQIAGWPRGRMRGIPSCQCRICFLALPRSV